MKLTVHPLFLIAGLLCAIFGSLTEFIICALTALLHECGHIFYAQRLGYACERVKLMPYGAAAVCDIDGISPSDEIKLALAGPAVNAVICMIVAALWWFEPVTYAYTDVVFFASAGMLLLNLLPAYPLDGGRVAKCVLKKFFSEKAADLALRIICGAVAVTAALLFFLVEKNYILIMTACCLACSAFEKSERYKKFNFAADKKKRGREIRYVILGENATYRDALKYVDGSRYLVLQLYGETFLDEITEDELYERLLKSDIYDKILGGRE